MAENKTRPALVMTILCDDVRQEVGGKISLMGLFETISAHTYPMMHPRFAIMNEWTGGRGEFTSAIRLLAPDQRSVISQTESHFALYQENQRHREVSFRLNTTFTSPGTYWVEILIDGSRAALVPLPVQQVHQQTVH
jgi:Family of unknown function (DUF6941)